MRSRLSTMLSVAVMAMAGAGSAFSAAADHVRDFGRVVSAPRPYAPKTDRWRLRCNTSRSSQWRAAKKIANVSRRRNRK